MFPTAYYQIEAGRYVPHSDYMDIEGFDFTGATVDMEVRDHPNGGAVRASTLSDPETITVTLTVTTTEGVPTTRIAWSIAETVMEAMPLDSVAPQGDARLSYDLHLTPDGGTKFVPFGGPFVVKAGVIQ